MFFGAEVDGWRRSALDAVESASVWERVGAARPGQLPLKLDTSRLDYTLLSGSRVQVVIPCAGGAGEGSSIVRVAERIPG